MIYNRTYAIPTPPPRVNVRSLWERDGRIMVVAGRTDGREVRSKDARGRERAVHPDDVHFTSPNEAMGEREEAEGDHEAASAARQPAWFEDEGLSPRDPLYAESCTCGIRATMTSEIQDKQIVFVRAMKKK